jgi:hypothetical protein
MFIFPPTVYDYLLTFKLTYTGIISWIANNVRYVRNISTGHLYKDRLTQYRVMQRC